MGFITDELLLRLRKQIEKSGTVVWYDPERSYGTVVERLTSTDLGGAQIECYSPVTGFLQLRYNLEKLWSSATMPPRLVIYVPLARQETSHALIEYELAGIVIQPGQQPPEQDMALATLARQALSKVLPTTVVARIAQEVEARKLSLDELNRLGEKGAEAQTGALAMIFDSGNLQEIVLRFLADETVDVAIIERQALPALRQFLTDALGISFVGSNANELRYALARQILLTEYLAALSERMPQKYTAIQLAGQVIARQTTAKLAEAWRNRRDGVASYIVWSQQIANEMIVVDDDLALEILRQTETFLACEQRAQGLVEEALLSRTSQRLRDFIEKRIKSFWSMQQPEIKKRWEIIDNAAVVLAEAQRIESILKGKNWRADVLLTNYALGDTPWCQLDTAHRHLTRDFHQFDPDQSAHDGLLKLVAYARQRYGELTERLCECFIRAYAEQQFEVPNVLAQADLYREFVMGSGKGGRIAYVLVDAFRFEMARELMLLLDKRWPMDLQMALATPPTITEVGMAALMPGAERGISLTLAKNGKLAVAVDGIVLKNRAERINHFRSKVESQTVETTLEQLAPLTQPVLRKRIEAANMVLVTASDEIDGLWEQNPGLAQRMMDDALNQLRRGINTLINAGIDRIVVTADHGYLFCEQLTSGEGIDAPGGQTALLKRRAWVGKGGDRQPGVLRQPLSAFGLGGDLELATPENLSCFKVSGGNVEYFHGGLSLPEVVIPVLIISSTDKPRQKDNAKVEWELMLGSRGITTRFVTATIKGKTDGLLTVAPISVRVEVRAENTLVSTTVSAAYGFNDITGDTRLAPADDMPQIYAPNTVTLMITETSDVKTVTVQLVDAETGRVLHQNKSVAFAIAI